MGPCGIIVAYVVKKRELPKHSPQIKRRMSIYFSKIIKTGERQREFNFRRLSNASDASYTVDVHDERGNRIVFSMYKNAEGNWKTAAQNLPIWIHNAETVLADAITENSVVVPAKKR